MKTRTLESRAGFVARCALLVITIATFEVHTANAQGRQERASSPQSSASALRAEIEQLSRAMERAFAAGDLNTVAHFYADDARLMGPRRQLVQGRAAIDAYWKSVRNPKAWVLETIEVGGSSNDAYQLGRSKLTTTGLFGQSVVDSRFIVIWRRGSDGRLRIAIDFYQL